MNIKNFLIALGIAGSINPAHAFQITSLSPQGEVARVRQVVVKFDESAVHFGFPKAPAPLSLSCSDAQATQGSGRWISDREWALEFEHDLPPGIACSLKLRSGIKSASGAQLTGASSYKFNSGGPFAQNTRPYDGSRIDEDQFFTLQLNGAATLASVRAKLWCAVDWLGKDTPKPTFGQENSDGDNVVSSVSFKTFFPEQTQFTLEVNASFDMTWALITDPVPGGATILGSGLRRDSEIATQGEKGSGDGWAAFEERSFESFRSYYEFLPKGVVKMEYTIRLNNVGEFSLPPSRVEAMYAPEMFGEAPNARVKVEAAK